MRKVTPCAEWEKKLSSTHPDDLSPSEQIALDAHIAICPACAFTRAQYHEMDILLRSLPPTKSLPSLPPQLLYLWREKDTKGISPTVVSQFKPRLAARQASFPQQPTLIQRGALVLAFKRGIPLVAVVGLIITSLLLFPQYPEISTGSLPTATSQFEASATATVQGNATTITQANVTATAQAATATALAQATATATAYATTITAGTLILHDPLQDNSQGYNWDVTSISGGGGCAFTDGAYHSSMPQQGYFSPCFAEATNFTNFSYQIQMTFDKGDQGGIAFRGNAQKGIFYYFHINRTGTYALETYNNDISTGILKQGSSSAIKTGLNQTNLIAVAANGNQIDLYVNMQHIDSVSDSTYSSGQIGVIAEDISNSTDVGFTNIEIWLL